MCENNRQPYIELGPIKIRDNDRWSKFLTITIVVLLFVLTIVIVNRVSELLISVALFKKAISFFLPKRSG